VSTQYSLPQSELVDMNRQPTLPWLQAISRIHRVAMAMQLSGTSAQRPTTNLWVGRPYFDTDLGKPVWLKTVNPPEWIDASIGGYLTAEPASPAAGMVVLADGVSWDPGSGEGMYRRNAANTAWVFIG
jgi:hypothetical protein